MWFSGDGMLNSQQNDSLQHCHSDGPKFALHQHPKSQNNGGRSEQSQNGCRIHDRELCEDFWSGGSKY